MFPTLIRSRLRAITIVLAALLLAGGVVSVTPRPAAATGGACGNWFDNPGTVYANGDYRAVAASPEFWDSWQGRYTHLNADIQSWRYTGTGSDGFTAGHCYRQIRGSTWVDDGSWGTVWLHFRVWANLGTCSQLVYDLSTGPTFAGGVAATSPWEDYSGCGGPKADVSGHGKNADWTPYWPDEVPSPYTNLNA